MIAYAKAKPDYVENSILETDGGELVKIIGVYL